ncbi:hypothetical protein [Rickettsia conorii]|uniref:hypothetical protein n=1 Tax=Rickettsia conorii TaxID=781 RepID=UPI000AB60B6A|nr:hypothetical protein [Rickettsia conorii]
MYVKLIQYLKKLESIAFGPWLNKYKQLFTSDELETELFDIIIQAQENKKHFNKELFILSNNVIERKKREEIKQSGVAVIFSSDYRANLYSIFTWLTNFQLEQYARFILTLPKNYKDYEDYFLQEKQQDGYSKIKAFNNVQDKKFLARKYFNLSKHEPSNNYPLFQENTLKL